MQWDYTVFGRDGTVADPDGTFQLKFEKIPGGRGGYNRWTINGKSWPATNPLFTVQEGKRYRLVMNNSSGDEHPLHMHRHTFEVVKVGDKTTSGLLKDTISMPRYSTAEVQFVADNPGATSSTATPRSYGRGLRCLLPMANKDAIARTLSKHRLTRTCAVRRYRQI